MNSIKVLVAALALSLAGAAQAGKEGTAGGGVGTGGTISSDGSNSALFGGALAGLSGDPQAYLRLLAMPGAVKNADGTVTSPPIKEGDELIRITLDPTGKIVRVEKV